MDFGIDAGQIITVVAALAAVFAAIFAGSAPRKNDLECLEDKTAQISARVARVEAFIKRVNDQMKEKRAREAIDTTAQTMSISMSGNQEYAGPLQLIFIVNESKAVLTNIELRNAASLFVGLVPCTAMAPCTFTASVENLVAQKWFNGGAKDTSDLRRVVVRAHVLIQRRGVKRDVVAYLRKVPQVVPKVGSTSLLKLYDAPLERPANTAAGDREALSL